MWDGSYADRAVEILEDLVAIPSHETEKALALCIGRRLRGRGLDVTLTEVASGRPNLVARLASDTTHPSVMLQAHLDTVPPARGDLEPYVAGGKLFGRGACDTCGSMAAMIAAVECLAESSRPIPLDVVFVGNMGEETGGLGSRSLVESGFTVDAGIVGEPTDNTIVLAHKGLIWMEISVGFPLRARDASLGSPDRISAIERVLEVLERDFANEISLDRHPRLGARSLNVGMVRTRNLEEEACTLHADLRILPGDDLAEMEERTRRAVTDATSDIEHVEVQLRRYRTCPSLDVPKETPLVRALARATASVTGDLRFGAVPYSSDGGVFSEARIPIVLFGPGKTDQAHSDDEYVEIAQVRAAAEIYYRFLFEFAGGPS